MYINMAYIEAKDNLLQFGVSQTAISTFKVGNLKQNAPVQPDEDDNQLPLVLGVVSNVLPPSLKNNFVAAITKPKEQNKEPALRAGVEPNVTKALASSGSENFTATNPLRNQLIATFGMVSIAALAYAVLNQVQRRRSQF